MLRVHTNLLRPATTPVPCYLRTYCAATDLDYVLPTYCCAAAAAAPSAEAQTASSFPGVEPQMPATEFDCKTGKYELFGIITHQVRM